jgi:hypothetical protein
MITFKLENADAEALVNTIVGLHFEPNFQSTLVDQLAAQTKTAAPAPVVEVAEEVVEEKAEKKSK